VKKDVIVLGGGIIGLSVAYFLAKRNFSIILIERKDGVALESSFGNAGGLWPSLLDGFLKELGKRSLELFDKMVKEDKLNFEYKRNGVMEVALSYEELEEMGKRKDAHLLTTKEVLDMEPNLSKDIKGALYHKEDAQGNCYLLAKELEKRILDMGNEIRLKEEVVGIKLKGREVKGVSTNKEDYYSDWVVNCCGAWANEVNEKLGFKLPIRPAKGIMVTFEAGRLLNTSVVGSKIGLVQNPNLRAGGTVEFVGYDKSIKEETVKFILEEASKILPKVKELKIVNKWAGLRPYVDDGLPIIGFLSSNFLIATGHFKNGFLLSPITGKMVSDMIEFGKTIEELSPKRFFKN